jgi:MEDS: MEthanogen/methylotroph, DcmR Sensory domain
VHSTDAAGVIRDMEPGSHAILIYDTPENKRDVLFHHLKCGVNNERLVYVCSEEAPRRIREEMRDARLDVDALEEKGRLSVKNYDDVYIVDGKVDVEGIVGGFSRLAAESVRSGFEGMRGAAEMSCFFRKQKVTELEEYENALQREFSFAGKGICAYNMVEMYNSGHLETAFPLMRAHGLVILTGPNGTMVLEPEQVKRSDLQMVAHSSNH